MKICKTCKVYKPDSEYYANKATISGLSSSCKECMKTYGKVRRENNPERHNVADIKRYRENVHRLLRHRYQLIVRRATIKTKHGSSAYGKPYLTYKEFIEWNKYNANTFYWLHLDWQNNDFKRSLAPSIDRIDNTKGYTVDNIRWVTQSENSRKGKGQYVLATQ